MIQPNFQRLASIVIQGLIDKLTQPVYQVLYRKVMQEFQTNGPEQLFFQSGRPKINGTFPCVALEAVAREDKWGATSHTKEITIKLDFTVAVKDLVGQKPLPEDPTSPININQVEHYTIALAELMLEILNEPLTLQYTFDKDQDGNTLNPPLQVYDSLAESINYGFLYNGALRIAKIPWFGTIMRLGPSGSSGFFNPPAPQ